MEFAVSNTQESSFDIWRIPAFGLWVCLFAVGLVPEQSFHVLRALSGVMTQTAMVNSPVLISVSFAAYLACFAYRACRASGQESHVAQTRAVQVGVLALVAFVDVPYRGTAGPSLLQLLLQVPHTQFLAQNVTFVISIIVAAAALKLLAWAYLMSLLARYYLLNNRDVFARMLSLFPSGSDSHEDEDREPRL